MTGQSGILGIFLIMMGLAMGAMCLVYYKTGKLNFAWMSFGFLYTLGLMLLLTDNPIKTSMKVANSHNFFSLPSLIILMIGIMLSFVLFHKKGERFVIASILFVVGVHFLPFQSIYTYVLGALVMINAIYAIVKENHSIHKTIAIDALAKVMMGIVLLLLV